RIPSKQPCSNLLCWNSCFVAAVNRIYSIGRTAFAVTPGSLHPDCIFVGRSMAMPGRFMMCLASVLAWGAGQSCSAAEQGGWFDPVYYRELVREQFTGWKKPEIVEMFTAIAK